MLVYNYQRQQSSLWARNTITIADIGRHDQYVLQGCAFVRFPTNSYAKIGNTIEWEFHVSLCYGTFGDPKSLNVAGSLDSFYGMQPYFGGFDNYVGAIEAGRNVGAIEQTRGRGPGGLMRMPPGRARDELSM